MCGTANEGRKMTQFNIWHMCRSEKKSVCVCVINIHVGGYAIPKDVPVQVDLLVVLDI